MTLSLVFNNFEDAVKATLRFIIRCLYNGGVPISRRAPDRDEYTGRTWICYGEATEVHSVRIYAPDNDKDWLRLNAYLDTHYGDWRTMLTKYAPMLLKVADSFTDPDLRKFALAVARAILEGNSPEAAVESARQSLTRLHA